MLLSPDMRVRPDLREALRYGQRHLSSSKRLSQMSYAAHGKEVAEILQEVVSSPSLLRVALLHDILQSPRGEILLDQAPLNADEVLLIRSWHTHFSSRSHKNNFDWPASYHLSVDPRLHLLLAAHLLADIRHLHRFPLKGRKWMCIHVLREAAPALWSLHLPSWVSELEDRSFLELQPDVAGKLRAQYEAIQRGEERYLHSTVSSVRRLLEEQGITHVLTFRRKSLYSLYRKMHYTGKSFEEITDRIGIRIVTTDVDTCYRILHTLQRHFPSFWGEYRDYLRMPKVTGYRSIHALLLGSSDGKYPLEIQICTEDLHWQNEYGQTRHSLYKWMRYFGTAWNPLQSGAVRSAF